jgi:hypothetical protein
MTELNRLIKFIDLIDQAATLSNLKDLELSYKNNNLTLVKSIKNIITYKRNRLEIELKEQSKNNHISLKIKELSAKKKPKTIKTIKETKPSIKVSLAKKTVEKQMPAYTAINMYKSFFRKNISVIKAKINEVDLATLSKIVEIPDPFFSQLIADVFFKSKNVYKMKIEPASWFHEAKRVNHG